MGTGRGQRWTFKEAGADGGVTLIIGGKVLVVDIESAVDREDETHPKPFVITPKTSYAYPSAVRRRGARFLRTCSMDHIQEFIVEMHKPLGE